MENLSVKNFYDLKFISNINIAKNKIFFEIHTPSKNNNDYFSSIFELRGRRLYRYSRGQKDKDMVVSEDGGKMVYVSKEDKKLKLVLRDIENGNENILLTTEHNLKSYKWGKDSRSVFVIEERKQNDEGYRIIDGYPIYFNGEGFVYNSEFVLLKVSVNGRVEELWNGTDELIELEPAPDNRKLALIIRQKGWDVYDSRLALFDISERKMEFKTNQRIGISNIHFLNDGKILMLVNWHRRSIFESPVFHLFSEGQLVPLSSEYDISISNSVNSDSRMGKNRLIRIIGDKIYFISTVSGRAGLYSINLEGKLSGEIEGNFSIDGFDVSGDKVYFISQSSNEPQEVWEKVGLNNPRKITTINRKISSYGLVKPENFKVPASDGKDLECWFMKGTSKSTILEIHGGPRTSYGEGFIFEFHLLNKMGFNILFSNPRGSDSYGNDFALEIKEKYGERDFKDIMEIIDTAVERYGIDPDRIGVEGGSYGGFMVNWIIGHTNRFRAATTDRSISDQISFYFTSDIGPRFNGDQIGGNPLDNLDHYWDKSPIKYYRNIKTPLLIIHSDEDFRCPLSQAIEFYTALKTNGNEVRLVIFKGENHELSRSGKPKNRIKRLEEISGWFSKKMNQ